MKICKDCKKEKEVSDFYPQQGDCKECFKRRVRTNRKKNIEKYGEYDKNRQRYSIDRIKGHKYAMMKMSVDGRNSHKRTVEGKELCTREVYEKWFESNRSTFMRLYRKWKASGFNKKLAPSIDRINNAIGYVPENMQWLTLSENTKKYNK